MNKLILLSMTAYAALLFTSCRKINGEGPVVSEKRGGDNFTSIAMRLPANVYYTQDSVYSIELKGQQNILRVLETPILGNELVLRYKNDVIVRGQDDISIFIHAPAVTGFSVSGSGNFSVSGNLSATNCRLSISGSGSILMPFLATNNLDANITGSGNITVSGGTAGHQVLRISGSGSIDLLNLSAKSANTVTSGSGSVKVNIYDRLDVNISGSGNVYYRGNPLVNARVSGSGKVVPL